MVHLREVLRALRGAGLTANPNKCAIGRVEVRYLGFHLGHGQVHPQIEGAAGRRASRPESGGGGMWRGGRGSAKSAAGEKLRRQR